MIIKTGTIKAGDGPRVCSYVTRQGDNEHVHVLKDGSDQLLVADDFAQLRGRKNGLLHIIISPSQELAPDELERTLKSIRSEFGYNPADPETLSIHESKRADGSTQKHYHLVRPASNSETGKTYKLFKSKCRDEAICRFLELEFGHKLVSGAHNGFAQKRLREMGRNDYADRVSEMAAASWSAFDQKKHQQAKRNDFNLPALRQRLKEIAELDRLDQSRKFAELIDRQGLELLEAIIKGRGRSRINLVLPGDLSNHNANRTLKIQTAKVPAFIHETMENLDEIRSNKIAESRYNHSGSTFADHRWSESDSPKQSGNDQKAKCPVADSSSNRQELVRDVAKLVAAADYLKSEIKQFSANRGGDLTAADLDAPPDISDPNLMRKLSAMLRKSMAAAQKVVNQSRTCRQSLPGSTFHPKSPMKW